MLIVICYSLVQRGLPTFLYHVSQHPCGTVTYPHSSLCGQTFRVGEHFQVEEWEKEAHWVLGRLYILWTWEELED